MRNLLLATLIAPVLLASPAASAFVPEPGIVEMPNFPVALRSEPEAALEPAFVVAFGLAKDAAPESVREIDGRSYTFRPVVLQPVTYDVYALLSVGSLADAGHGDGGINAVHYLQGSPTGWISTGEWLGLGAVGTVGNGATAWGSSIALGRHPYFLTSGGGVWQGCAISSTVLTQLTPERPIDRGGFTDGMSSGAGLNQVEQSYDGAIVAADYDKGFTVAYTGTKAFEQRYVLKKGKYELVGKDQVPGC